MNFVHYIKVQNISGHRQWRHTDITFLANTHCISKNSPFTQLLPLLCLGGEGDLVFFWCSRFTERRLDVLSFWVCERFRLLDCDTMPMLLESELGLRLESICLLVLELIDAFLAKNGLRSSSEILAFSYTYIIFVNPKPLSHKLLYFQIQKLDFNHVVWQGNHIGISDNFLRRQ